MEPQALLTIHDAARAGDVTALISFLHSNPLSLNSRDRHSRTPLHLASWAGHVEAVRFLCDKHADVGASAADDMAAIHFACQKGHVVVVRHLLAAGASAHARTRKGMTPLHYAVQGGYLDVAKMLMKKGADLFSENKARKKAIDLAKDENFRNSLLAAEKEIKEAKAAKKNEDRIPSSGDKTNSLMDEAKSDSPDSPPKKKTKAEPSKVQLSHLADGEDEEDKPEANQG